MKPEQQRIAIAEACPNLWIDKGFIWSKTGSLVHPFDRIVIDPLNDLNAMHEAEKMLVGLNDWELCGYVHRLHFVTNGWSALATAAQRAEAFLNTLSLWKS